MPLGYIVCIILYGGIILGSIALLCLVIIRSFYCKYKAYIVKQRRKHLRFIKGEKKHDSSMTQSSKILLYLVKDNVITMLRDWLYEFPPTTIYHHAIQDRDKPFDYHAVFDIEIYEYDYTDSKGKHFYKFISTQVKTS